MLSLPRSLALPCIALFAAAPALAQVELAPEAAELASELTENPPQILQDYEPNPPIWRLADADTTIYMFGTFHALPPKFRWRTAQLDRIIEEVDEIVFESRDDIVDPAEEKFMASIWAGKEGKGRISERLSEGNAEKWRQLVESLGVEFEMVDPLPPALAVFAFGLTYIEDEGSDWESGVENVLEAEFLLLKKPISAIEDPVAVMRAMLAIDDTTIIESLDKSLSEWDGTSPIGTLGDTGVVADLTKLPEGDPFELEHNWAKGILDPNPFAEWRTDAFGEALYDVLIVDRNAAWSKWLVDRLDRPGTILLAVGAGHFEGADSVQTLLAAKGFYVERLNPLSAQPAAAVQTQP